MTLHSDLKKKQAGFSLTEFAIVLGVIGLVIGGLWSVVAIVRENINRTSMKEQLAVMVPNIRNYYINFPCATPNQVCPPGSTDLTNVLLQKAVLPYEQLSNRNDSVGSWYADHPWHPGTSNGSLRVLAGDRFGANTDAYFRIQLLDLNRDSCIALSSKLTGAGTPDGLVELDINGTLFTSMPVAPEDADAPCDGEDDMTFVYTLRAP